MRSCALLIVLAMLSAPSRAADEAVGPQTAKVLWVHKGAEHFVASPVAGFKTLYVSSLGAFNTGNFYALSLDPAAKERVLWAKTPPYLKLPVVSAPVAARNEVIFGDGMHQTDGATLRAVEPDAGRLIWEYSVPGELVHMEGTPATAGSKVYMGAGSAGVFCAWSPRRFWNLKNSATARFIV
jgi:outer membrane protein assembly factor BamB